MTLDTTVFSADYMQYVALAGIALICVLLALYRSYAVEKHYQARDEAFRNYLECLERGDIVLAEQIRSVYARDPVFAKHAEAANRVTEALLRAKTEAEKRRGSRVGEVVVSH